jgi:hypothetical protein
LAVSQFTTFSSSVITGCASLLFSSLLFLFNKIKAMPQRSVRPTRPPTTPPAIAPTLVRDELLAASGGDVLSASGVLGELSMIEELAIEVSIVVDAMWEAEGPVPRIKEINELG